MTDDKSELAADNADICSSRASDLPSEAGLVWEFYDSEKWHNDPNITCTAGKEAAAAWAAKAAAEQVRLANAHRLVHDAADPQYNYWRSASGASRARASPTAAEAARVQMQRLFGARGGDAEAGDGPPD